MPIALSFIFFLILFTVVGMYAATQKRDTTADYLLAGRKVNSWAIALINNDSVFGLITFAWSILASGLGVLLILRCFEKPVSTPIAIAIMLIGIATAMTWKLGLQLSGAVYEVFPGMAAGVFVYLISSSFMRKKITVNKN